MHDARGDEGGGRGRGGTRGYREVNTGACIVCGERAGSVAILRIAPRRFCFRSRCPDRFLPPHTPLLFRRLASFANLARASSSSKQGEEASLSTDKGNRCVPSSRPHPSPSDSSLPHPFRFPLFFRRAPPNFHPPSEEEDFVSKNC